MASLTAMGRHGDAPTISSLNDFELTLQLDNKRIQHFSILAARGCLRRFRSSTCRHEPVRSTVRLDPTS
jgi:hypothetical protein